MKYRMVNIVLCIAVLSVAAAPTLFATQIANQESNRVSRQGLGLRLVGIASADDPSSSVAVFESNMNGRQKIYREDDLVGGMLIKQILYDRIIVQTVQGEKTITITGSMFSNAEPPGQEERSLPISYGPRPPVTRRHDMRYLDRKSLTSSLADIDEIIKDTKIEAVSLYGKPAGVKISPIEPGSIFADIGLRNGEVIKEVNGEEIFRPEQAIAILRQLKTGGDVDIKVKGRRTRQIHLILD